MVSRDLNPWRSMCQVSALVFPLSGPHCLSSGDPCAIELVHFKDESDVRSPHQETLEPRLEHEILGCLTCTEVVLLASTLAGFPGYLSVWQEFSSRARCSRLTDSAGPCGGDAAPCLWIPTCREAANSGWDAMQ